MGSSDRINRGIAGRARLLGLTLAVCLAIGAVSAAPSLASTVSTGSGALTYTAASGEANQAVVSLTSGNYTVQDSGATITAGAGCSLVNANKATCAGAGITALSVNAGNMTNTVWNTTSTNSTIIAGDGNDTLIGGSGNDALIGCGGDDTYNGGPGADTLVDAFGCAGGGNDTFDGGPGPDAIFGGSGSDTVTYASRTASVFVSLDNVANDGEAGEGDNVHDDVENVTGGTGDDNISGSAAANIISGAGGDDVLVGEPNDSSSGSSGDDVIVGGDGDDALAGGNGANLMIGGNGNDALYGGPGGDTIAGGAGNDVIHAQDGVVDTINCGPDTDTGEADDFDVIDANCESLSTASGDDSSGIDDGSDFSNCGSDFRASASDTSDPPSVAPQEGSTRVSTPNRLYARRSASPTGRRCMAVRSSFESTCRRRSRTRASSARAS